MVFGLAFAMVVAGCAASRNPAAPVGEAIDEPDLIGDWVAVEPDSEWPYLHIIGAGDGPTFEIVAAGGDSWAVLEGHLSRAGDRLIANLRVVAVPRDAAADIEADDRVAERPWSFVAIRLDGSDRLTAHYLRPILHDAVGRGLLSGVTDGDYDVFIDAAPADITAFLASAPDEAVYTDPLGYRRLPPMDADAQ